MSGLEGRIAGAPGEVARRLEAGEGPSDVARALGLGAVDVVAAIADAGLVGEGPGLEQGRPTRPSLGRAASEPALAGLFPGSSKPARLALSAGLLQVLDLWDLSHEAAQEADDLGERASAAYWHMIAHRREPDAGNAHYWARRVGRHPILGPLAEAARPLLQAQGDPALPDRLIPRGVWSPAALIDLATRARPGTPEAALARQLQRLEMVHLLEASLGSL